MFSPARPFAVATLLLGACGLSSCTTVLGPTTGDQHAPSLPAVVVCFLASCNSTFADKTARAGDDVANADRSSSAQTAESTPTLTVVPKPGL